jgi:hypothetical protein
VDFGLPAFPMPWVLIPVRQADILPLPCRSRSQSEAFSRIRLMLRRRNRHFGRKRRRNKKKAETKLGPSPTGRYESAGVASTAAFMSVMYCRAMPASRENMLRVHHGRYALQSCLTSGLLRR